MTISKITPDADCKACHGTGLVTEWVPWGATSTAMESYCDCVIEQINDDNDEIELVFPCEHGFTSSCPDGCNNARINDHGCFGDSEG